MSNSTAYLVQFDAYQVRLTQLVDGIEHVYKFWALPQTFTAPAGNPANTYNILLRDATAGAFDAIVEAFLDNIVSRFTDESSFVTAELWKTEADSQDFQFLTAFQPTTQPIIAESYGPATQTVYTARTLGGNIFRVNVLEGRSAAFGRANWVANPAGTSEEVLADYLCEDNASPFVDRQGTFPFAPLRRNYGQNEVIFRKRFR